MPQYARGSLAWGLCQKCGLRFLLAELVFDGYYPGLRVCSECWDDKHPQERLAIVTDPEALYRPSPDNYFVPPPFLVARILGNTVQLNWTSIMGPPWSGKLGAQGMPITTDFEGGALTDSSGGSLTDSGGQTIDGSNSGAQILTTDDGAIITTDDSSSGAGGAQGAQLSAGYTVYRSPDGVTWTQIANLPNSADEFGALSVETLSFVDAPPNVGTWYYYVNGYDVLTGPPVSPTLLTTDSGQVITTDAGVPLAPD